MIRCLLSEQSLLLLLQLQGFQRCRCTPKGCHIQFVLFFLFPFKSSFFLSLKIARLNLPSEYFSYSHLIVICKTRIACDNVGDQSCICFFSFTTAQAQTKTCRKGRGGEVASKLSFLKLEMNNDANVYTISVYNNGIFQSFQFSVFTFQASS